MAPPPPWLSVLVPVYNVRAYLVECVESVMAQADPGVEVLLLDDCSTDGSAELAQQLQARWPAAVRFLRHTHNQGLSAARNTMLAACRGDYVWFLDSDDFLLPGALDGLRQVARRQAPDLVLCDFRVWREREGLKHVLRGERHRRSFLGPSSRVLTDRAGLLKGLFLSGQMHAWSKIARRALWEDGLRFPAGAYFEDMATMPRLLLRAASFIHVPEPWVAYRQRAGSILSTMGQRKAEDLAAGLERFTDDYAAHAAGDPRLAGGAVRFAIAHLAARNYLGAMRALERLPVGPDTERLARRFARQYRASSPLTPQELLGQYLRRGWLARYLRARRALQRAESEAAGAC